MIELLISALLLAGAAWVGAILLAIHVGKLYKRLEALERGVSRLELEGIYKNEINYGHTGINKG